MQSREAFKHIPQLIGKIVSPELSQLRATPERVALWDEMARRQGLEKWRFSDDKIDASRRLTLSRFDSEHDLWIFGYGSLMWDPAFYFSEVRRAEIDGYQRRFSIKAQIGRGSAERPALMLSLEASSGVCQGLAFRLSGEQRENEAAIVWRREMIRGDYSPLRLQARTPQGPIDALVFGPNPSHAAYAGVLPVDEVAAVIATATGVLGSNRDYLEDLVSHLDELEIEEDYVRNLLSKVRVLGAA